MKTLVFIFMSLFPLFSFTQKNETNVQHGYAAEGYDVVAYFSGKAIKGNKKYTTTFHGIKYQFVSKENLELFLKSPEKFIPAYGGWCAYAMGKDGSKIKIDPKTFKIIDGKLYLFYNSFGINTLQKWEEEGEEKLRKQADKYWLKKKE